MSTELEQKHTILREMYKWYGVLHVLVGSDPEKDDLRDYDEFARLHLFRSDLKTVEDFQKCLHKNRVMARKRLAAFNNEPANLPWPTAGTKVWAAFTSNTKEVLCEICKGRPLIEHEGGTYCCTTCHGKGSKNEREVRAIEVTVVKAEYSQDGGAEGWGEVGPLYPGNLLLWHVNDEGRKFSAEGGKRDYLFQTKEDCEKAMESLYAKDHYPRWRQT